MNTYRVSLQHSVMWGERQVYTVVASTAEVACSKSVRAANNSVEDRRGGFYVTSLTLLDELVR